MIAPVRYASNDDPDTELMLRIQNDETDAFVELYSRHHLGLVRLITHMMGDHSISEDLAQQVFLRIYRARKAYTPTAKFTTWQFSITRNVVLNARRNLGRRQEVLLAGRPGIRTDWTAQFGRSEEADPMESAAKAETRQIVTDAIGKLAQRQQQAIRLVYLGGCTYRDAARQMGVTESSIRQLLHRAKQSLRRLLETGEAKLSPLANA